MTGTVSDPLDQLANDADAVTTTSRPAFAAVSDLLGTGRILFGSDYPYVPIAATARGLRGLGLDARHAGRDRSGERPRSSSVKSGLDASSPGC